MFIKKKKKEKKRKKKEKKELLRTKKNSREFTRDTKNDYKKYAEWIEAEDFIVDIFNKARTSGFRIKKARKNAATFQSEMNRTLTYTRWLATQYIPVLIARNAEKPLSEQVPEYEIRGMVHPLRWKEFFSYAYLDLLIERFFSRDMSFVVSELDTMSEYMVEMTEAKMGVELTFEEKEQIREKYRGKPISANYIKWMVHSLTSFSAYVKSVMKIWRGKGVQEYGKCSVFQKSYVLELLEAVGVQRSQALIRAMAADYETAMKVIEALPQPTIEDDALEARNKQTVIDLATFALLTGGRIQASLKLTANDIEFYDTPDECEEDSFFDLHGTAVFYRDKGKLTRVVPLFRKAMYLLENRIDSLNIPFNTEKNAYVATPLFGIYQYVNRNGKQVIERLNVTSEMKYIETAIAKAANRANVGGQKPVVFKVRSKLNTKTKEKRVNILSKTPKKAIFERDGIIHQRFTFHSLRKAFAHMMFTRLFALRNKEFAESLIEQWMDLQIDAEQFRRRLANDLNRMNRDRVKKNQALQEEAEEKDITLLTMTYSL
ncbi:hypothetical protein [Aneurinibacillus tyrosinisolvens]|uniref:hypothetical protein n=1 Tax=Aneurinibacillus tyrosinisolvens TaxID=1443435 RepID=UPI00063F300E|nr:hypothetical protein [Aneurinibacillus tyrosinisolvens]